MNVLPFHSKRDIAAAIPAVAAHFCQGGLLGHPTETVYGLGSRPEATQLQELAELKRRNPEKPFILLVSGREMAEELGLVVNEAAAALAAAAMPGAGAHEPGLYAFALMVSRSACNFCVW